RAQGVRDLIIRPPAPLTQEPPAAMQRLLDYLDTNGFRYGLSMGPGMQRPLSGTIVDPAVYRVADAADKLTAAWSVPQADSGLFVLVDSSDDNKVVASRIIAPENGTINGSIDPEKTPGRLVALLYPHVSAPVSGAGALPDLWGGFDSYRDNLLSYFGKLKLGAGLRFFLDPITSELGLSGLYDYVVPDSPEFRLEWEAYLERKYSSADEIRQSWGLTEGDFSSFAQLATLIPLWANGRGVNKFYYPALHATLSVLDVRRSLWWQDFLDCRSRSIRYYMNAASDVLKKEIADVPVVCTWTQTQAIYWNQDASGGFDGLAVRPTDGGMQAVSRSIAPAYSEAEQSARTTWFIATGLGASGNAPLDSELDMLRRAGVKGFFAVEAHRAPGTGSAVASLASYVTQLSPAAAARYAPEILYYPQAAPGPAEEGFVPGASDTLWLGSFHSGDALDWWPSFSGYSLRNADVGPPEIVLISLQGKRETHLYVQNSKNVRAYRPSGAPVLVKTQGKNVAIITLDQTPTIIYTDSTQMFPQEAAKDALSQLAALVEIGRAQHLDTVESFQAILEQTEVAWQKKAFQECFEFARGAMDDLTSLLEPYIWLEGERPYQNAHTFTDVAVNPGASGGAYLRLSTPNPSGRMGYGARYVFDVPADGQYDFWLAGTPPGPDTSPIRWRVNSEPLADVQDPTPRGPLYMEDRFGWFLLGSANLKKGNGQSFTVYVTGRAPATNSYTFAVDALMITSRAFHPNGPYRPLPVDNASLHQAEKKLREQRSVSP
ncbi:MAG TPA: hypothetical protein VGS41_00425, partial [Chthonomonadales bacterium]|nr:hypothetical protein [Chthonomonadales bacterium]